MSDITMPRLSDTMTEGTITRWLKQLGDQIAPGDVLAEIETDKATMELEAYEAGTLSAIRVQTGTSVPIGTVIATIGTGSATDDILTKQATATPPAVLQEQQPPAQQNITHHHKASPMARRIAHAYGINLANVVGTGPDGRILKENVEAFFQEQGSGKHSNAVAAPITTPPPTIAEPPATIRLSVSQSVPQPLSRMRRAIATRMSYAKHGTPHFYVSTDIHMGEALALRRQINESGASPTKISVNDMVIKATAHVLVSFPALNSSFTVSSDGHMGIITNEHININVAIAVEGGLLVPVIADANTKSLGTIVSEVRSLILRARDGSIKQHELDGGTFTVSNLGMYDVTSFTAIITPPQAGVLAVGAVQQRPVVRDDAITIGSIMSVTLSADHRVVDGAVAAHFLQTLKYTLETPLTLLV